VAIDIHPTGNLFDVSVSPPHANAWNSTSPLTATEVLDKLSSLGCHSTDITDALDGTGVDWCPSHDAEVQRRLKFVVEFPFPGPD
jgi:hypothetical protein